MAAGRLVIKATDPLHHASRPKPDRRASRTCHPPVTGVREPGADASSAPPPAEGPEGGGARQHARRADDLVESD